MATSRALITLVLLGALELCNAAPPYLNGNTLFAALSPQQDEVRKTFAMAYIVGIVDTMNGIKSASIGTC